MINIGTTDFYIGVPSMPEDEFEIYSTRLFDEWEEYTEKKLILSDYSLLLEVEEGSVKVTGKITAALFVLYIGIGEYGSFVSGLETIHNQVSTVNDFLAKRAALPFESSGIKPKIRKRGESLSRLQGLFGKVQRGEITVEQAMHESEILFGDEAATAPEFMRKLYESFKKIIMFPKQIPLFVETPENEPFILLNNKNPLPRPSRPKSKLPPSQQLRVEIWRDSKKGKRNIRIMKL